MSNSTFLPSANDLKPLPWMAEWCTKQSFCPFDGVMKPKPFASLNHFTVPVVRAMSHSFNWLSSESGDAVPADSVGSRTLPPRRAGKQRDLAVSQVPGGVTG